MSYLVLLVVLAAVCELLARLPQWAAGDSPRLLRRARRTWRRRRPRPIGARFDHDDVNRLTLELSRLSGVVQDARVTCQPGRARRTEAALLAYDDLLLECGRRVQVPVPRPRGPLSDEQRLDLEMALSRCGVRW